MSTATITIYPNGIGKVAIDGMASNISATGVQAAEIVGLRQVTRHAARTGEITTVVLHTPAGTSDITIDPDGTLTREARPQPTPALEEPTAQHHDDEPAEDADAFEAIFTPEPEAPERPATPEESAPVAPPAEVADPAWAEIAQRPAARGLRGTMNALGFKLSPTPAELTERRAGYDVELARQFQEQQEQEAAERRRFEAEQREAETARQRQEQETRRAARARELEKQEREQRRIIQTNFQGAKTILVANPKGGARKTTTTYLVGATLGIIRGGGVITWDANETMGTLGDRAAQDMHSRTVVDLLEQAADDFDSITGSRLGTLDRFVRNQHDSHFDVLASDEDATRQDIVDRAGFNRVHEILTRFYRLVLVDTGNNIRAEHFLAAVDAADQLVIPVAASRDSAKPATAMMQSLTAAGHGDLVANAVVLIHDLEPSIDADEAYLDVVRDIASEFEGKVAAVVPIPFDPALKGGDEIDYAQLAPATQTAYRHATATIATSLRRTTLNV